MRTILQINSTINWGSTGRIAESIGNEAIKRGWISYFAYGRWSNPSQSYMIKVGGVMNKYIHYLEQRVLDNEGLNSRTATKKLIRQIKTIKPDVVQLHNIHDHFLNYRLLFEFLNQTSIKVVWTFHDCWAFTGHCTHFVKANCNKWRMGCFSCPLKGEYPKSLLDRSKRNYELKKKLFTSNDNLIIVTVSEWLAGLVRQSFFKGNKIKVINNGVDLRTFHPIQKEYSERFKIIGVATAWNKDKGLYDFFKLRELLPESDYEIMLIGLSSKQIRELPKGIMGKTKTSSAEELAIWYNMADVVLSLSKAETFGLTIAEGMACGTPAIVYGNTAQKELVAFNTGFVVEDGDVATLCDRIQEIKKCGKEFFSIACRRRAENYFNKDKSIEKYIRLYEELIDT